MYNHLHSYQFTASSNIKEYISPTTRRIWCGSIYFDDIPELVKQYEEKGEPLEEHDSYEEGEELEDVVNQVNSCTLPDKYKEETINRVKLVRMLKYGNATKAYEWAKELKENGKYPGYTNKNDKIDNFDMDILDYL